MKRRAFNTAILTAGASIFAGCGGSSDSGSKTFRQNVSGKWNGSHGQSIDTLRLTQSGNRLSGTLNTSFHGISGPITGTRNKNLLEISGRYIGATPGPFSLTLTLVSETQMSGTLTETLGGVTAFVPATFTRA